MTKGRERGLWAKKEKKLVSITTRDSISSLRNYLQVVESTRHATLLHHHVLSFVHDFLMPSSFFSLLILPFSMGIVIITRLDVELFLFYIPPSLLIQSSPPLRTYFNGSRQIYAPQTFYSRFAGENQKTQSSRHSKSIIESSSSSF
jgi:hypothetical protein